MNSPHGAAAGSPPGARWRSTETECQCGLGTLGKMRNADGKCKVLFRLRTQVFRTRRSAPRVPCVAPAACALRTTSAARGGDGRVPVYAVPLKRGPTVKIGKLLVRGDTGGERR
jgi:hypothetical protein